MVAFAAVAVRLAWVGDDAYITLRCVENWVTGNGLRWNVDDRVQTYTHPLWMLLLALGRVLSGEVFHTTIWIGVTLSVTTVAWLLLRCRGLLGAVMVGLCVLLAQTFGDYATSGLETSLTYLLLVAFALVVTGEPSPRRYFVSVLLASLLATNRMDLALLCAPAVVAAMRSLSWRTIVGRGLLGALPFAGWLVFATIYYGTPLPVTALAKAFGLGIPAGDLAMQGLRYLWDAVVRDPVLVAVIVLGFVLAARDRAWRWLALGMLLYLGYVVKVGGDFMAGRFLLPPFVLAVARLADVSRVPAALLAVPLLGALLAPPGWLRPPADDPVQFKPADIIAAHGIVDERRAYYGTQGLLSPQRTGSIEWGAMNRFPIVWPEPRTSRWIAIGGATGVFGFGAGDLGHLVDPLLCDPLLARLPAADPGNWRIGHVLRRIPEGYLESIAFGGNRIRHPGLHRYYDALATVLTAPVFASERWRAIWSLWRGDHDADLRAFVAEQYRTPPRLPVTAAAVAAALPNGNYWFDEPRVHLVYDGGLEIAFPSPVTCGSLHAQISGLYRFRFTFRRDGAEVGQSEVTPSGHALEMQRLQSVVVPVPPSAGAFDQVWIDLVTVDGSELAVTRPALGSLQPAP